MMKNLFAEMPAQLPSELVSLLAQGPNVRVERIVSMGHASPAGFWYDQAESEWVVVLLGEATLQFDGDDELVRLGPGDHINIAAHRRHRVQWTTPDAPTVWLAVFYEAASSEPQSQLAPLQNFNVMTNSNPHAD